MGIIKFLRKKYWEDAIFMGGRPILLSCDGMTKIPDKAYALFTEGSSRTHSGWRTRAEYPCGNSFTS